MAGHERVHRMLKESAMTPPMATSVAQQRAFDLFRADYNEHRPHEALQQTPPAKHYEPSRRSMPERLRPPQYADDMIVRSVSPNGFISWKGARLKVAKFLGGQPVGLKQTDDDEWELFYGPTLLGDVLRRGREIRVEPIV
jgi:putative transposase